MRYLVALRCGSLAAIVDGAAPGVDARADTASVAAARHRVRRRLEPAGVGGAAAGILRGERRHGADFLDAVVGVPDLGAPRRPLRHRARRHRQPRRLSGRAGRGEDRRQPRPLRVPRQRQRLRVDRRGAGGAKIRRPQGQDRLGRRDDHRLRVRRARAPRAQRRRGNGRHATCAPAARRTATASSSPASTTRHCCARRSSCSLRERGFNQLATAEIARRLPGDGRASRGAAGRRGTRASSSASSAATGRASTGSTTGAIARSSRRCSSPTSAT